MKKLLTAIIVLLTLSATAQRGSDISIDRYYHIRRGNVWFHATRLMYGYQDGIKYPQAETDTIYFYNNMDKPLEYSFTRMPDFLSVQVLPSQIPAKSEGKIAVTYDTKIKGTYGPTFDYFFMKTNDSERAKKRLIVSPKIKQDFSGLSDEEMANAPEIAFEAEKYDFGTLEEGEKITHSFSFTNKGERDLIIRATDASCGCTSPEPEKKLIAPGESGSIKVIFNSRGKKGKQHQRVTVIANDPDHPVTTLHLNGTVKKKD
ncbi:MAG: DUF1573 domain-containing protein [Bacteroidales bacterium]|nr:DUF1573 domain-containing protein [Bacteroidales bacterium]MCF8334046.1 DUF1573 domain-containing protein [Bacteroidales bacterium]